MNTEHIIYAEHLAKTYVLGFFRKKIHAISDVNLQVNRGEIFGLLGPNGAGKTTTLKVLLGLVRASSGKVSLLGHPAGSIEAKRKLGYLTESPYFYDYLTARELLHLMANLCDVDRKVAKQRIDMLLEKVDLTRAADMPLRRYSKGMLQRAGLAQALVHDPELVILDEPMSGLDPIGRKQVRELIAQLRHEGKTVVFSSHILSDVELLADQVAILVRGKTVAHGPLHVLVDARVQRTDIAVRHATPDLYAALDSAGHPYKVAGDLTQIAIASDQDVDRAIDLVRQHHGKIAAIIPQQESLEDVVLKQIAQQPKNAAEITL